MVMEGHRTWENALHGSSTVMKFTALNVVKILSALKLESYAYNSLKQVKYFNVPDLMQCSSLDL